MASNCGEAQADRVPLEAQSDDLETLRAAVIREARERRRLECLVKIQTGAVQLALLAFGIVGGIEATGVAPVRVLSGSGALLGDWAPWLGVLVFAVGVTFTHSTPRRAFLPLLVVMYSAWVAQVIGNVILGGYVSAFVGAAVMTPVAYVVARHPSAMPARASFLPGFWLLVPGSLGLIGLTTALVLPGSTSVEDVLAIVASIASVALGVLCGVELHAWLTTAGGRVRRAGRRGS